MSLTEQLADMGFEKYQMYISILSCFVLIYIFLILYLSDSAINKGKAANLEQALDW